MFGNLSSEKSSEIISKISKKVYKVWVFESKNPVFGSKSLEKVWKSSEKSGNWVFQMFGNFGNFGNCSFLNFLKITKKWH